MALSATRARQLLLGFDDVRAAPHFDRTAFRTPRRIFATLANDGRDVDFMFDPRPSRRAKRWPFGGVFEPDEDRPGRRPV